MSKEDFAHSKNDPDNFFKAIVPLLAKQYMLISSQAR